MTHSRFELHRDEDVSGVSGAGVVAEGVEFSSGVVALRWLSEWPTSVVFHDRGMEAVRAVHGHGGKTRIVWLDDTPRPPLTPSQCRLEERRTVVEYLREWEGAPGLFGPYIVDEIERGEHRG